MNAKQTSSTVRRGPAGRPARVSRDDIVRAARRIVDDEGLAGLTMRRLAGEVGTTPMALYHYVCDKNALLVRVLVGPVGDGGHRNRRPHERGGLFSVEHTVAAAVEAGLTANTYRAGLEILVDGLLFPTAPG